MLSGKFENCYGIKEFDMGTGIDFSQSNVALIYAPNGVMKTSLTKVFEDLSRGEASKDRIFASVETSYAIHYNGKDFKFTSKNSKDVPSCDSIYVINSFLDNFEFTKETVSTLLADDDTRREYNSLMNQFANQIKTIEAELATKSGFTKPKVKEAMIADLCLPSTADWPDIINAVNDILESEETIAYLGEIKIAELFHEKAIKEYKKPEFKKHIQEYIERLSELLQNNDLLNTSFTDRSAENLSKSLYTNDLFSAQHKIILRNGSEICSVSEWNKAVDAQIKQLYTDETLRSAFEKLEKNLTANNDVDAARQIIIKYREVIPLLSDIPRAKKLMWVAYCSQLEIPFNKYYKEITTFTEQVRKLYERAAVQSDRWQHVVEEFNRRFRVPFAVKINNKSNFILKDESPNLSFVYKRRAGVQEQCANLPKNCLLPSLSMGEKRAMYLLYILFDLEKIRIQAKAGQRHLVIADDIADSFDYKNKYAIIEYLADLSQSTGIDLLILTHNFDFYRTVMLRLQVRRYHCFIAQKDDTGKITMSNFRYQRDFFKNVIIAGIKGTDNIIRKKMLVASIPFYRNLTEYCGDDNNYLMLTCFLHYKSEPLDTSTVKLGDLWKIIKQFVNESTVTFGEETYYDTVQNLASDIVKSCDDTSLENKLVLSIASRLKAEKYLKKVILEHESSCNDSKSNQMRDWYDKAKTFLKEDVKRLMDDINLITPESIHLNAFMYEPLIDISIWTLNDIFNRVNDLL